MEDLLGADGRASELVDQAISLIMTYAPKVVLAIITLVIGLWLINRFVGVLDSKLGKKDPTLNKVLCGLIGAILKILLFISVA
ncbi:MAG: mechanosensitive ion channel family protein, partial [Marinobacter sp.]|nr:mechanosensitive ion channel family protein [Marinobacter sp.]